MDKNRLIQLEDYINDKSKLRLNIFAAESNCNKKQLILMIDDFIKDRSKQRLKLIENLLNDISAAGSKIKTIPKLNKLQMILQGEKKDFVQRREDISNRLLDIRRNWGEGRDYTHFPIEERTEYESLKRELNKLETQNGLINNKSNYTAAEIEESTELSRINILTGILGNISNTNSIAYKLINGHISKIQLVSHIDLNILLKWLDKYNDCSVANLYIVNNLAARGKFGKGGGTLYEIISKQSGIQPSNPFIMTNEKGADVTGVLGASLPMFNNSLIHE